MGMNREPNQHNPFSRGSLNSGGQYEKGSEQCRDTRLEPIHSALNGDFLGSHQLVNNQQLGMLQSSPRQHSGLHERQLLPQQAMARNLYKVQMQQDIRQANSINHLFIGKQKPKGRSASLSNTNIFQDGSTFSWMTQHGVGSPNWLQDVASPVRQGTSNGLAFSTEQSDSPHILGFYPQLVDHSLYGFPVSNTRGSSSQYYHSMEKPMPASQREPSESIPLPANQYGALLGRVSAQDRDSGFGSSLHGNNNLMNASSLVSYPGTTLGLLSQAESQQRNPSMEFHGIQGVINSKEQTVTEIAFLQDAAPLDQTEEIFLFGSDDNVWDAFGKSSNSGLDDYNMVKGSEFQNPFPSMQSGSWSALMQSALAETCRGDTGYEDEWSGLNLSGKSASVAQEPLASRTSEKQSTPWVTNGNSDIQLSLNAEHYKVSNGSNATKSHILHGLPMSSSNSSADVNGRFQSNSASKRNQQISEGNMRCDYRNLKAHSEDTQIHSNSGHHPVAALNLKSPSNACAPQHGTPLNNSGNQAYNKSSQGNHKGCVPGEEFPMKSTSNANTMHHLQDEQKRIMHDEKQNDESAWTRNSFPNSPAHMGQLNPDSCIETDSTWNSSYDNLNSSQKPPTGHHLNRWKHVGFIPEVGSENMERSRHPLEVRPRVLDSLVSNSDEEIQVSGTGDYGSHENSGHVQQSNLSSNISSNGLKDTAISGQSDPNVAVGKQKTSDQFARKSPGLGKFQYHPMGNLDENTQSYFGMRHTDDLEVISSGQTLLARKLPKSSCENDKGKRCNSYADARKLHEESSVRVSMDHFLNKNFDKSGSSYSTNKMSQSSQNMLELLDKADQLRENSAEASRNASEHNMLSEKPASESPDVSMSHLQRNQSSGSHAYGLQLGPPHQRFPTQIHDSSQAPNTHSLNSGLLIQHRLSDTSQAELHDARSGLSVQSGNSVSLLKVQESSSAPITSGFPILRNQYQNQTGTGNVQLNISQCISGDKIVSQLERMDGMRAKASTIQSSIGSQFNAIESNRKPLGQGPLHVGVPSSWTNVPEQQTIRGTVFPGTGARDINCISLSLKEEQNAIESSSKAGVPDETGPAPKVTNIPGKDEFFSSGIVTHPDRETSGTSMKMDTKSQNSYSLLHQLQVMKSTESDPNNRVSKRLKGQDISSDAQQSGQNLHSYSPMATEVGNINLVLSGDSKSPNFTSELSGNQCRYTLSQRGSMQYQNTPALGRNDTQNQYHSSFVLSNEPLPQISHLMAPSWFERYGSFNREQLVPASDVWKHSLSQPPELAKMPGDSSSSFQDWSQVEQIITPSVSYQVRDIKHSLAPEPVIIGQSSSPQLTSELIPRCKEVTRHGLLDLPNNSASEVEWASATKWIPEKAMDEVELAEDRTVMLHCKRRLVLTTQLIQELLETPPGSVMSSDAYMSYEILIYFTSRDSYRSACSLSGSQNPCIMSCNHNNMISKKLPEQGGDLLSPVKNDFLVRAAKLENAFSSLEKQISYLDLRIERQDLEKFSVINRFAKFHGREQADRQESLYSAMNSEIHGPQRYVTALPPPRNLPDTVQCLSL